MVTTRVPVGIVNVDLGRMIEGLEEMVEAAKASGTTRTLSELNDFKQTYDHFCLDAASTIRRVFDDAALADEFLRIARRIVPQEPSWSDERRAIRDAADRGIAWLTELKTSRSAPLKKGQAADRRDSIPPATFVPKAEWERQIFLEFVTAAGLHVDPSSVTSAQPPAPDIAFSIHGQQHFAELVEITDQQLARRHMISLKEHRITGGAFSQKQPLAGAFTSKSQKSYATNGAPLMLLAYYDKQYPADSVEPDLIPRQIGGIAAAMIASGVWSRIWVYTRWQKKVIWVYPTIAN
ncbi:MAG: hypothetical protein ACYC6M_07530 [Terriglobales bacterium]